MKTKTLLGTLAIIGLLAVPAGAQITVSTAVTNNLNEPYNVVEDTNANIYISDSVNNRIVMVDANTHAATTLSGVLGVPGSNDGPPSGFNPALFNNPQGLLVVNLGGTNGLLVTDSGNNLIRFINLTNGSVVTLAGNTNTPGVAVNAAGTNASFNQPIGMDQDTNGNVYIADEINNTIRVMNLNDPAVGVTNLVVTGTTFRHPTAVAFAGANQLWVADSGNNTIKLITLATPTTGSLTTYMGGNSSSHSSGTTDSPYGPSARFNLPSGLLWINGLGLLISDTGNNSIRLATNNPAFGATNYAVTTFAGTPPTAGSANGSALSASFNSPEGLCQDPAYGAFLVADLKNNLIRRILTGLPPLPPAAPIILTVTTNFGQVSLTWSTVPNATGYNVERAPSSGGPYAIIATNITATTFTDTTVVNGTTYYYVITALNAGGEGPNSAEVNARPPLPPVPDPQIGWVTFPPTANTSVFNVGTPSGNTFNNDVPIVIKFAQGSQAFYIYSNTPSATNLPDPTSASSSAPVGYLDGLSSVAGLTVAQVLPNVAIKAIGEQSGHPNSAIVSALFQFVVGNPGVYGANAALFTVSNITAGAQMYYTTDGSDPTNDGSGTSIGPITSGTSLSLNVVSTNLQFKIRGFRANYQPSNIVTNFFSAASFVANAISFGTPSGEPSSKFMARPGQFYYAPVTLEMLPGFGKMYSLQFNVTVTNGLVNTNTGRPPAIQNGAGINFFSMLMTQVTPDEGQYFPPTDGNWYLPIPPYIPYVNGGITNLILSRFVNTNNNLLGIGWLYRTGIKYLATDTNGIVSLDFDTAKQDLTAYSIAHDTLFIEANGKIVVGAYSFQIPTSATNGDRYFIQLGSPSATRDGVGAPGASIYIQPPATNQAVTVGSPAYIVGDVATFHWLNAGDFGDTNLDNSDVMQVYQSAVLGVDMPPVNSDLYRAMDSCGNIGISNAVTGYFTDGGSYLVVYPATNMVTINNLVITNDLVTGPVGSSTNSSFTITNITVTQTTNITVISTNIVFTTSNSIPIPPPNTILQVNNITLANTNTDNLFDGNDQTINQVAFGDGNLDICDVFVTLRRSLDTSLFWFERYWTNGQLVAVTTTNLAFNTNIPALHLTKSANQAASNAAGQTDSYQQSSVSFTAGDAQGYAGQQVQIPITANVFGSYNLRVLGLDLTVYPLDGSPDLTQPVQFTPAAGLGAPTSGFSTTKGNDTYAAAWLDSTISGFTGSATIGTLTITIPANATSLSAYAIHFNHASGSPNGLASFPKQTLTGLITLSSRTNSYYHDGIPDSWRLRYFGTIYNYLSVSNACPSGDGVNNWQKYTAGVDPSTPNDFPSLNSKMPVPSGATAAIHWPTVSGKQYVILRSSSLFPGNWTAIATNTGTGTDMEFDDNSTGAVKFYRVLILP